MPTKKRVLMDLVAILGLLLVAGGCRHRPTPALASAERVPAPVPAPAPTVTLTAEPNNIQAGDSTTLSWTSENATNLDLSPGVGKVETAGSTSLTLRDSTTFTLTATGPGGTETATARVTVRQPPPPPPHMTGDLPISDDLLFVMNVKDTFFDFDKASVRPDAEQTLAADAGFLKERASIKFTIEGHCDERGSEEYNLGLGDRRATATKDFLVNSGVSADRINTISYGKTRPVCADQTEKCWQKNRRAHFHPGGESK
jgi:peptidoglycan-associated lipoprotein